MSTKKPNMPELCGRTELLNPICAANDLLVQEHSW